MLRITHFYQHFCVRCVSFVLTCAVVNYLISVYAVTTLISQTRKNNKYCLVWGALLTDKQHFTIFYNISRRSDVVLKSPGFVLTARHSIC